MADSSTDAAGSGAPSAGPSPRLVASLRLIRTPQVGPATFEALVRRFGGPEAAIAGFPSLAAKLRATYKLPPEETIHGEISRLAALGGRFLCLGDADYPQRLAGIEAPPPVLATCGDAELLARPSVALVGARNASAAGRRFARQLARELGEEGVTVISGLARGIDTAAHEGSLESGTVAVLAGGVDYVYPPENERLHEEIGRRGCRVSEMPVGYEPQARHFPQRNRLIAGLADVVVVVEAAQRSGALITARLAAEAGRDVLAVPGSPLDPRAKGANRLIRNGAALCEGVSDVLEALEALPKVPRRTLEEPQGFLEAPPAETGDPDALKEQLAAYLSQTPTDQDDLARETGLPVAVVAGLLLELELEGRLQRLPGQKVALI